MKSLNLKSPTDVDIKGASHALHLYTARMDKYAIQGAFLASIQEGEEAVYVTADKPRSPILELNLTNAKLRIIKPEDLGNLGIGENNETRIIIDAGSFTGREKTNEIEEIEGYINELIKNHSINCLCTYDVSKLNPDTIKQLVTCHNKLRLTTSDLTVLSGDFFDKSKLSCDSIKKIVKDNLEIIILALLQTKPMCGIDIIETMHFEFNVLLSPGTIYPLLHSLKDRRLLKFRKNGKVKIYAPAADAELKIRNLVNEQIQARSLLNRYLREETTIQED